MKYLIGLGNYSMGDDSIGLRIIEHISENNLDDGFEPVEAGNNGMQVLTYFEPDTELIVMVDAVKFGGSPGDIISFTPDDVITQKTSGGISTHEGDFMKLISLAKEIGQHVPPIKIVAIEPESMTVDAELSPLLAARFEDYVSRAISEISS